MIDSLSLLGSDGSNEIVRIVATPNVDGMTVKEINESGSFKLFSIVRNSNSFIAKDDDEIQINDILYFVIKTDDKRKLKILLGI